MDGFSLKLKFIIWTHTSGVVSVAGVVVVVAAGMVGVAAFVPVAMARKVVACGRHGVAVVTGKWLVVDARRSRWSCHAETTLST